jgi:hypothetical protein
LCNSHSAQVGKALLHSKGGFVALGYRACKGLASGLVPEDGTELNNAPAFSHRPRPAAAGAVEGGYLRQLVQIYFSGYLYQLVLIRF